MAKFYASFFAVFSALFIVNIGLKYCIENCECNRVLRTIKCQDDTDILVIPGHLTGYDLYLESVTSIAKYLQLKKYFRSVRVKSVSTH